MKLRDLWFYLWYLKWRIKTIVCRKWHREELAQMRVIECLVAEIFASRTEEEHRDVDRRC